VGGDRVGGLSRLNSGFCRSGIGQVSKYLAVVEE